MLATPAHGSRALSPHMWAHARSTRASVCGPMHARENVLGRSLEYASERRSGRVSRESVRGPRVEKSRQREERRKRAAGGGGERGGGNGVERGGSGGEGRSLLSWERFVRAPVSQAEERSRELA